MKLVAVIAIVAAVSLTGCITRTMTLPPGFVRIEDANVGQYAVRGMSADGVMIALRAEKNPQNGNLAFWSQAIATQMVSGRGYKAAGSEDVTSAAGTPGRLLTFTLQKQGVQFTYLLTVFVQGDEILLGEAGGKSGDVEPKLAEIRKALLTAR